MAHARAAIVATEEEALMADLLSPDHNPAMTRKL